MKFKGGSEERFIQFNPRNVQSHKLEIDLKLMVLYTMDTSTVPKDHGYPPVKQERAMENFHTEVQETYLNIDCCLWFHCEHLISNVSIIMDIKSKTYDDKILRECFYNKYSDHVFYLN